MRFLLISVVRFAEALLDEVGELQELHHEVSGVSRTGRGAKTQASRIFGKPIKTSLSYLPNPQMVDPSGPKNRVQDHPVGLSSRRGFSVDRMSAWGVYGFCQLQ